MKTSEIVPVDSTRGPESGAGRDVRETSIAIRSLIGQSGAISRIIELIHSVASSSASVLIVGESGTGKELVARAIHMHSQRAGGPMVSVNCAALTETLLESELFGHEKGAFTGATSRHSGLVTAAHTGSLFLDEIGEMALTTQAKLLRTLQEGEVRPVGATQSLKVDVRIIAATNVDLEQRCREGGFRQDLFYRLNVLRIEVPPLRQRKEDIPLLAHHFLRVYSDRLKKHFDHIHPEAMRLLCDYDWPGNIRELQNVIERIVVLSLGPVIEVLDLPPNIQRITSAGEVDWSVLAFAEAKELAITQFEQRYLQLTLNRHRSVAAAARAAGMDRSNFKRLLKRHNLTRA